MTQPTGPRFDYKAPPPITRPDDPRRAAEASVVQRAQDLIYTAQKVFADETLAFKALRLAWEATRLAWYAVRDETDGDHLDDVRAALRVVEEHLGATVTPETDDGIPNEEDWEEWERGWE